MMQKYAMEIFGTFFLTLAVVFMSLPPNPLAIGLVLMALLYIGGHVSGGHYNPAVSLGFFLQGKLGMEDMGIYFASQTIGAMLAMAVYAFVTGIAFEPDVPIILGMWTITAFEVLLTGLLVLIFLTTFLLEMYGKHHAGLIVGLTLSGLASMSLGTMFNPAIAVAAMGSALMYGGIFFGWELGIMYLMAPMLGAAWASFAFDFFNKK
jgi:aquaporin Z